MKRILTLIASIALSVGAFAIPSNVQVDGPNRELTNNVSVGSKTLTIPDGGTITVQSGATVNGLAGPSDLAAKANDNAVVKLTGDQTIAGNKTFSGTVTLSSPEFTGSLPSKVVIPRTGYSVYAFGDSTMYGTNSQFPDGRLPPEYRLPDMLASRQGANLTSLNYAVPGSRVSWKNSASNDRASAFNQTGNRPYNYTGVTVERGGWNNTPPAGQLPVGYIDAIEDDFDALISKHVADWWDGIAHVGWNCTFTGTTTEGWETNITSSRQLIVSPTLSENPFSYNDPSGSYYGCDLGAGKYIKFTSTGYFSNTLHFLKDSSGGVFTVKVNGVLVGTYSTIYNDTFTGDYHQLAVTLNDVPEGAIILVENVSGSCIWLARSATLREGSNNLRRWILAMSISGNTAGGAGHPDEYLTQFVAARMRAVGRWGRYFPVYFGNAYNTWVQATDSQIGDESHYTPIGAEHDYQAAVSAHQVPFSYKSTFVELKKVFLNPRVRVTPNGLELMGANGNYYIISIDTMGDIELTEIP